MKKINRKHFLKTMSLGALLGTTPYLAKAAIQDGEKIDPKLVHAFVGAGHRDMEKVKALLEEHPTLINTAHDWNNGDFETCLGAASHVGHKEMAKWLIKQGAQANIFTAALFGRMDIVKPLLDFFPTTLHAKGPHGFTLLHHAIKGGDEALEVKEYLVSLGAKETKVSLF